MLSTVTCFSSMHSSSADCVLGEARLISSPTTMLAKTPPGPELELAGVLVEHRDPGDVRGQQVRGELDPAYRRVDAAGQGLAQHRLADAGHVLDQQVTLGEQHDQRRVDDVRLALDDLLDVPADPPHDTRQRLEVGPALNRSSHVRSFPLLPRCVHTDRRPLHTTVTTLGGSENLRGRSAAPSTRRVTVWFRNCPSVRTGGARSRFGSPPVAPLSPTPGASAPPAPHRGLRRAGKCAADLRKVGRGVPPAAGAAEAPLRANQASKRGKDG